MKHYHTGCSCLPVLLWIMIFGNINSTKWTDLLVEQKCKGMCKFAQSTLVILKILSWQSCKTSSTDICFKQC